MTFFRFAVLFLAFNSCMADNTDAVQVAMNASRREAPMKCGHLEYGFINNRLVGGPDVTGYLKSCPDDIPYNKPDLDCASEMCLVDPDRYTCCSVCTCVCPNGEPAVGDETGGESPPAEEALCDCVAYGDRHEDCTSCATNPIDGYWRLNADPGPGHQFCIPYHCTCPHGNATYNTGGEAERCEDDGAVDCYACDDGYHLSATAGSGSQTCEPNICYCMNGVPTYADGNGGTLCKYHDTTDCSHCACGFDLNHTADVNSQHCVARTCTSTQSLALANETMMDISDCDGGVTTGTSCTVSCKTPYTGTSGGTFHCECDGTLVGTLPECHPIYCSDEYLEVPPNVVPSDCGDLADGVYMLNAGQSCHLECADGYESVIGSSPTTIHTCTATTVGTVTTYSWEHTVEHTDHLECMPKNCTMTTPANGGLGDCTMHMEHGSTCQITCNDGYEGHGQTQCLLGNMSNPTECYQQNCSHVGAPENGLIGDCPPTEWPHVLAHGSDCNPQCQTGYYLSPTNEKTTCMYGVVSYATCEPCLYCQLIYKRKCSDNRGFWTYDHQYLNYEGCERFCNIKHSTSGHVIHGCELDGVTSGNRLTTGNWCFAHTGACTLSQKAAPHDNAACNCLPGPLSYNNPTCPGNVDGSSSSSLATVGHSRTQNHANLAAESNLAGGHVGNKSNTSKHGFKRHVR